MCYSINSIEKQHHHTTINPKSLQWPLRLFLPPPIQQNSEDKVLGRTKADPICLHLYLGTVLLGYPACGSGGWGIAWEFEGCKWWIWAVVMMLYWCFGHGWDLLASSVFQRVYGRGKRKLDIPQWAHIHRGISRVWAAKGDMELLTGKKMWSSRKFFEEKKNNKRASELLVP